MHQPLETIQIEIAQAPQIVVIWLHGLGADGHDFVPIINQMDFSSVPAIRFIFPHAPVRPITVNGGARMRGWYDITGMDLSRDEDETNIKVSVSQIDQLVKTQIDLGIEAKRIFLAGFSQGGAIALYSGLTSTHQYAGIIALSSYVPMPAQLKLKKKPPIFYAHGADDPIIPLSLAVKSRNWLKEWGIALSWHVYPIQHQVAMQEIHDLNQWLIEQIKAIE